MNHQEVKNFFTYLKKTWLVFGPKFGQEFGDKIFIDQINDFDDLYLGPQLPFFPFKKFFVPEEEVLFEYKDAELKSPPTSLFQRGETEFISTLEKGGSRQQAEGGFNSIVLFGMNLLDLKSVLLYDQVFEKDPSYQSRRQNTLIVGHSLIPEVSQNIFEQTFEEDTLEHLNFDIFLGTLKGGEETYVVFTGSQKGQKILEEFGYNDYIHIQFSGPVKEGKLDERMLKLKDKLENHHNQKIWDELGQRCIECGKCTIACPTCFCFRIDDVASLDAAGGQRQRCWDSCYYQEFSEVAGGHKFSNSTASRIHFWYFHKFARIPDEFNFMGCVGCRRCSAVCPVGIDIAEVLKNIETG